jgi:hypothetical protein
MFTLKIDDGICKGFKDEDGLDFFVNKAYDEEANMHCLLIYVPKVPEFNITHVQQPLGYKSEKERDDVYKNNITDEFVNGFWDNLISKIKESKNNKDETEMSYN